MKKEKAFVIIPGDTKLYQSGFWDFYRGNKKWSKLRQSEDSRSRRNHLCLTSSKNKIDDNVKTELKRIWWKTINFVICWTAKYWLSCATHSFLKLFSSLVILKMFIFLTLVVLRLLTWTSFLSFYFRQKLWDEKSQFVLWFQDQLNWYVIFSQQNIQYSNVVKRFFPFFTSQKKLVW